MIFTSVQFNGIFNWFRWNFETNRYFEMHKMSIESRGVLLSDNTWEYQIDQLLLKTRIQCCTTKIALKSKTVIFPKMYSVRSSICCCFVMSNVCCYLLPYYKIQYNDKIMNPSSWHIQYTHLMAYCVLFRVNLLEFSAHFNFKHWKQASSRGNLCWIFNTLCWCSQ